MVAPAGAPDRLKIRVCPESWSVAETATLSVVVLTTSKFVCGTFSTGGALSKVRSSSNSSERGSAGRRLPRVRVSLDVEAARRKTWKSETNDERGFLLRGMGFSPAGSASPHSPFWMTSSTCSVDTAPDVGSRAAQRCPCACSVKTYLADGQC